MTRHGLPRCVGSSSSGRTSVALPRTANLRPWRGGGGRIGGAAARLPLPPPRAATNEPWQPVVDPSTGNTYYWNTLTNATQWEAPSPAAAPAAPAAAAAAAVPERGSFGATGATTATTAGPSREDLLRDLVEAMGRDGSGMAFWEAARERRPHGVFEDAYIDWLTARVEAGGAEGEVAERVRARLVNPLLRQPAPFE
jgi:hypothetical protein